MKRDHENNVLKCLGRIQERAAGRAVLAELRARPSFSACIFPFDFRASVSWSSTAGATTSPIRLPQTAAERARGTKPRGTDICENGACWGSLASKTAKSVDVFFTARRFPDGDGDGALLHELVHATRIISGVFRYTELGGGLRQQRRILCQYDRDDLSIREETANL